QIETDEKTDRVGGAVVDEHGEIRQDKDPVASKEAPIEHRMLNPQLPLREQVEPGCAEAEKKEPCPSRQQLNTVHGCHEGEAIDGGAHNIETLARGFGPLAFELPQGGGQNGRPHQPVQEEYTPPPQMLREKTSRK